MTCETQSMTQSPGTAHRAAIDMTALEPRPAIAPRLDEQRFIARDGTLLPVRAWLPEGSPRAVMLALHGFNDYSNAFAEAGPRFAAAGIATYAYDQRGFGAAPRRGSWAGADRMVDDALTALRLLRQRHANLPLYLLGESMGGAVAVLASVRLRDACDRPDGIILLAPAVWGRAAMTVFERVGLWLAGLMPAMRWSPRLVPMRIRASDNIATLRALGADPLVIKETRSDTLNGLVDLMGAALQAAPRFAARALILYGAHDQIVPRRPVEAFIAALPTAAAARQDVAFYPAGYHLLLRDLGGPKVIADIIAWIDDPGARRRE
jgi:alpha-beta hydrolase superfamily lysophospholipase